MTPEDGGSHVEVAGRAVALKELVPQSLVFVPVVGAVDVAVDLHVPGRDGQLDYRGATGEATMRCASGCAIAFEALTGGSAAPPSGMPGPIAIDHFDARVVFANGSAELAKWTVDAKDLRFEVTGHLALAPTLADSAASVCIRLGQRSSPLTPGSRLAQILASADIAIDANGLMSIKLGGRAGALEIVDFGCDGQPRPPPPHQDESVVPTTDSDHADERAITKRSDTAFDVDVSVIHRLLANPMAVAGGTRLVPAVRDGKPHGFKLYAIRPTSLFAKLGFANGDTLLAIDGHDLTTADDALKTYTSLRDRKAGGKLTVSIERGGKPMMLTYTLRGP